MPPRAGMPPCPRVAERTRVSSPCFRRGIHAERSPILGAPSTPAAWHLTHCACTICSPLRSAIGADLSIGVAQWPPEWLTM